MRKTIFITAVALLGTSLAWAQGDARPKNAKTVVPQTKPAERKAALAPKAPEAALSQEELTIAQRVHHGRLPCELGASVQVEPDHAQPGYFNVQGKGFRYRMHPVATSTGAIRLEDKQAGAVWLQLANKSMLMDQKKGQRVADECANPEQMAYAEQMKTNPPPALIEVNTGR